MIYIEQKSFKKDEKIIAYPCLMLGIETNLLSDGGEVTMHFTLSTENKREFYKFAKKLGFIIGEVKTSPPNKILYLD